MEATIVRGCLGVITVEMPLVYQTGAIACSRKYCGERCVCGQEVGTAHVGGIATRINLYATDAASRTHIIANGGVACVLACHQGTARRTGYSASCITLCEGGASFRQTVDVWRLHMLAAKARQVANAQVIGKNKYDIRTLGRCLCLVVCFCCFGHCRSYESSECSKINIFLVHNFISPQLSLY